MKKFLMFFLVQRPMVSREFLPLGLILAFMMILALGGCDDSPVATVSPLPVEKPQHILVASARHQTTYVAIDVGMGNAAEAASVRIGNPAGPGNVSAQACKLLELHQDFHTFNGPIVEQYTGAPMARRDAGSYLSPCEIIEGTGGRLFAVNHLGHLYLQLTIPNEASAGTYSFPVDITESPTGTATHLTVDVVVTELVLPVSPAEYAIGTTTTAALTAIYPDTFGMIQATYLDRGSAEQEKAIAQLDSLVRAAEATGVDLFVEDLAPVVHVDAVGRVAMDWDAYDRTMLPYMEGSAFDNRLPFAVWLMPAPPRRIRDLPAQLRQYWTECLDHYHTKGWPGKAVIFDPRLTEPQPDAPTERMILYVIGSLPANNAMVSGSAGLVSDKPEIWCVDDMDQHTPPVGRLGSTESVRVWPWMCKARGAPGLLWRNAVARQWPTDGNLPALLVPERLINGIGGAKNGLEAERKQELEDEVFMTTRLAWLAQGLTDVQHDALVDQRGDPALAADLLAGMVGRTGLPDAASENEGETGAVPAPPLGYLYAGWPAAGGTWQTVEASMDQLVAAGLPGQASKVSTDDPLYLSTKMWLAQAHRPVGRVVGYKFGLEPSREGTVLTAQAQLLVENPISTKTELDVDWPNLPGDFSLQGQRTIPLGGNALVRRGIMAVGHLEALHKPTEPARLELQERTGGAMLDLPVVLPVQRMRAAAQPPVLDGRGDEWPNDGAAESAGPMAVNIRYATRPDLLAGVLKIEDHPARVRWMYDVENIYVLIECPQVGVTDDRTSQWPMVDKRWWGGDGVTVQIAGGAKLEEGTRVIEIGIKPSGIMLTRSTVLRKGVESIAWADGPVGIRHGVTSGKTGYTAELAIPRKWFAVDRDVDQNVPAWRVNVLRHRKTDEISTTWSGPVVNDEDLEMMGLLVGAGEQEK